MTRLFFLLASFCFLDASHAEGLFRRVKFEPEPTDRASIVRAQIFLDENLFGPGKIDGRTGKFTRAAVAHFNFRLGLKPDDWSRVIRDSERTVSKIHAEYTIKEKDFQFIGVVPNEPAEQSKLKYLSYRSVQEFVAERFHTDEKYLAEINPGLNWNLAQPGTIVVVPNVSEFRIEDIKKHQSFPKDAKLSERQVIIDTTQSLAAIWEGDQLIAMFPVTPGQEKFIHRGKWTIQTMVSTPEFRWDKSMLEQGQRSDEFYQLPPGPNNPVGILWAGLNKKGIGLHGTAAPHTIGRSRSAGCVRFANWDAIRLAKLVRPGATVEMR